MEKVNDSAPTIFGQIWMKIGSQPTHLHLPKSYIVFHFVSLFSARELELEDRQSRLQQELRERMAVEGKCQEGQLLMVCVHVSSPGCSYTFEFLSRSLKDRWGAVRGKEDPEWDAGSGGTERLSSSPSWGAAVTRKGGGQGPRSGHALQRL